MGDKTEKKSEQDSVIQSLKQQKEVSWENPRFLPLKEAMKGVNLSSEDIDDAERRLARFAPFFLRRFPETALQQGFIESPLRPVPRMKAFLNENFHAGLSGRLLLKMDSHLPVAGSVKARGGIYEILKHAEDLALEHGLLQESESYEVFASPQFREFFRQYAVHVGSTGNLGLSIGIISSALGFRATVHMSADARQWKKDLLRQKGVEVMEYPADYSEAVRRGRELAGQDPYSYFVDDENSIPLFLGYAVAARRLAGQLEKQNILVNRDHPLLVFLPCGVGGAPGGITFGLKQTFGDFVHCFFIEPVQAPCMLLGMSTGRHNEICVQDIGLTGLTHADGLAVGRPSKFVGKTVGGMVSGFFTVSDGALFDYLRGLMKTENIFIEPSAGAAFHGPVQLRRMEHFLRFHGLTEKKLENSTVIAWATGGSMVPEKERDDFLHTFL